MRRICVFCGAHVGTRPAYARAAAELGRLLAERGIGLVTGGGSVGLMGEVADAALAAGGEVIGVITEQLNELELGHRGLSELVVVPSMPERKARMHALSDGFATLPGGLGTLEEVFEVLAWLQLGIHRKPVGLLDVGGFYAPLLAQLDRATEEGFIHRPQRDMVVVAAEPRALLDLFAAWTPPPAPIWSGS